MLRERAGGWGRMAAMLAAMAVSACAGSNDDQSNQPIETGSAPVAGEMNVDPPLRDYGGVPDFQQNIGDTIRFATDSHDLDGAAQSRLQMQAAWLIQYPHWKVALEGHADERGTREYNLALGERRANAAANYLVALGVDAARISVVSYGKERPVCAEAADACWAENRRAVTTLHE